MKQTRQLMNPARGSVVLRNLKTADSFLERFRGLMGKTLSPGEGLWITPCNSIHCFFMKIPIDVLFLNKNMEIVHRIDAMKPWTISPIVKGANSVIEASAGTFEELTVGEKVQIVKQE